MSDSEDDGEDRKLRPLAFPDPARIPMLKSAGPMGAVTNRRIAEQYFAGTAGPRGPYVFVRGE